MKGKAEKKKEKHNRKETLYEFEFLNPFYENCFLMNANEYTQITFSARKFSGVIFAPFHYIVWYFSFKKFNLAETKQTKKLNEIREKPSSLVREKCNANKKNVFQRSPYFLI